MKNETPIPDSRWPDTDTPILYLSSNHHEYEYVYIIRPIYLEKFTYTNLPTKPLKWQTFRMIK
jgi:hypothetical protein